MRLLSALLVVSGILGASGCSMCAPGFLDDYATVGGKWQRSDPTQGRVGSIFSEAGETVSNGALDQPYIEHHSQAYEDEVFGEAYTESYDGGVQEHQEFGELPADGSYYEMHDAGSYNEMPAEDGELMLSEGW